MSELIDPLPSDDREPSTTTSDLTEEEYELLADIALYNAEVTERQIDDRRLQFARWLVEHGKLSEEL